MKQWTSKEFIKMIKYNGFFYNRDSGDHCIYTNELGKHISVPETLNCCVALRLIKENSLNTNYKNKKYDTKREGKCFMCIVKYSRLYF